MPGLVCGDSKEGGGVLLKGREGASDRGPPGGILLIPKSWTGGGSRGGALVASGLLLLP